MWGLDSEAVDNNVEAYISFAQKYIWAAGADHRAPPHGLRPGGRAMLKKLRRKFIFINMSLVFVVLTALLATGLLSSITHPKEYTQALG